MKNLRMLGRDELVRDVRALAAEERRITQEVLEYLREIERRRVFAGMGYASLHEFCVRELKYSEGAAHRRTAAMRFLKEVPEAAAAVKSGEVNLSTLATVQVFLSN